MAEEDERNRLTGRIRRYTRVGTAVGGLAARLAGERYLGVAIDRERHAVKELNKLFEKDDDGDEDDDDKGKKDDDDDECSDRA